MSILARPNMDFRTPELEDLAARVIPEDHFVLRAEDARDSYFTDASKLDVKQLAHDRFRTSPMALHDHLLHTLDLRGNEELLDLGCGNGEILARIRPHLAAGHLVGLDIAPAILQAARKRLDGVATPCDFVEGSADDLSVFPDRSFDRVMAVYMTHYVTDLPACFAEVRRVLRPGGRFLLTTDRPDSMVELYDIHFAALRAMNAPMHLFRATPKARISLANGAEQLDPYFETVDRQDWQDQLQFAKADPFMAFYRACNYLCAGSKPGDGLPSGFFAELEDRVRDRVDAVIDETGYVALTKYTGTFICS
ncbi:class I SAM-dependent methyltransferase [Streptomyces montanus]|uniref:Class I SAM-dependent methyltransferase n=1 Tax=Streptomyces montanus TaxID=2580423 RepID=A0A5R9FZX8_9ACTN|nr:class I SAM-dependent methyltransferase [Streptomyces montanus]TLS46084.1 class I SAM-dependent methyltransferase [Streptomyces montanus]